LSIHNYTLFIQRKINLFDFIVFSFICVLYFVLIINNCCLLEDCHPRHTRDIL